MKISLYGDHLRINLNFLEKIGAAKGSFYIPYNDIVSAFSESSHNMSGFKVSGTNLPKIIDLGTYLIGTQKEFWYIKKQRHDYLVLVLKSNFYSKLVIESEKSQEFAKGIPKRIKNNLN